MIRFLLLIFLPLAAPFIAWYLWRVFGVAPQIDPDTGDQVAPDFADSPIRALAIAGAVLTVLTVGGFLLAHRIISQDPYHAIGVGGSEENQKR